MQKDNQTNFKFKTGRKSFEFRYSIGLHIDDQAALNYIQENLQIGKVKLNTTQNIATYNVIAKEEVALFIQLFTMFNLNSNKHLNFLALKKHLFFITQ